MKWYAAAVVETMSRHAQLEQLEQMKWKQVISEMFVSFARGNWVSSCVNPPFMASTRSISEASWTKDCDSTGYLVEETTETWNCVNEWFRA